MIRRSRVLLLACTLAVFACGDDPPTEPEDVVDFSGTWTVRLDFSYLPEDVLCAVTGVTFSVSQDGEILTGGSVGGSQSCSQTGTTWPDEQIGDMTLAGNARPNSVIFELSNSSISLNLTGQPRSGRFDGTFQGSSILEAFELGDVTISGTWSASR